MRDTRDRHSKGVVFCAAARLALGNFQRVTNVATALAERRAEIPRRLLTNSARGAELGRQTGVFGEVAVADRTAMAAALEHAPPGVVVASTMAVPGLERVDAPLCLILREVTPSKLAGFRLSNGRPWDLVVVPNPATEWMPDAEAVGAKRVEAVGWIYRRPSPAIATNGLDDTAAAPSARPLVLVTAGGGSGDDEHDALTEEIARLLADLRKSSNVPLEIVHARGPNARPEWTIPGADRTIEPGPALHNLFGRADLVISTAGYNSVLELACTDVPVLLMPIGRYSDDQHKRARQWGPRLGFCHEADHPERAVRWMTGVVEARQRRPRVDLAASGAGACAALIERLLA
jgi:predicted glycosyltransferase